MIRRLLRRLIPTYAILPLILTGITMLLSYQGVKLMQLLFGTPNLLDMSTSLDHNFPFVPSWSLMYIISFAFWIFQYTTVAKESPALCYRLVVADAVAKLICWAFFIFLPTTNVRPALEEGGGFCGWLMRIIWLVDTPTNLFPSAHCFVAWLGTRYIFECRHLRHRVLTSTLCIIGSLLVFLSTMFTKQHVFYDVIGGIAVAEIGWFIARFTALPKCLDALNQRFLKTRLSKIL